MDCSLGEVQDVKENLAVSPTGRCSILEGLRISSQSFDHLELATKEGSRLFLRNDEFNINGIQ